MPRRSSSSYTPFAPVQLPVPFSLRVAREQFITAQLVPATGGVTSSAIATVAKLLHPLLVSVTESSYTPGASTMGASDAKPDTIWPVNVLHSKRNQRRPHWRLPAGRLFRLTGQRIGLSGKCQRN